jgi:hypothetical protein
MSISLYAQRADGSAIMLEFTHPAYVHWANINAGAVLGLLGFVDPETGRGLWDAESVPLPEARRAIIRARATFARRHARFTRATEIGIAAATGPLVFSGGIDADGLSVRLDAFERFVRTVAEMGAVAIYWA